MSLFTRLRQRIAWIALAATLMSVLAPGVSSAMLAGSTPEVWGEICSAEGARGPAGEPGAPSHGAGMENCPFCLPQASAPALPSPERAFAPTPVGSDSPPRLFLLAPTAAWQWLAAQPRAPPLRG